MGQKGPRKIFEPKNVQELLQGWLFHAHKGRDRHDRAARRCARRMLWIGGSSAGFSAVVGTSVFAVLEKQTAHPNIALGIGLLSILSSILASLSTFLNLSERAEKHRAAGVSYKEVIRELERILSVPVDDLPNTDVRVVAVQKRLDELEERTPVVPEDLFHQIDDEWEDRGIQPVPTAADLYLPPEPKPERPQ